MTPTETMTATTTAKRGGSEKRRAQSIHQTQQLFKVDGLDDRRVTVWLTDQMKNVLAEKRYVRNLWMTRQRFAFNHFQRKIDQTRRENTRLHNSLSESREHTRHSGQPAYAEEPDMAANQKIREYLYHYHMFLNENALPELKKEYQSSIGVHVKSDKNGYSNILYDRRTWRRLPIQKNVASLFSTRMKSFSGVLSRRVDPHLQSSAKNHKSQKPQQQQQHLQLDKSLATSSEMLDVIRMISRQNTFEFVQQQKEEQQREEEKAEITLKFERKETDRLTKLAPEFEMRIQSAHVKSAHQPATISVLEYDRLENLERDWNRQTSFFCERLLANL